MASVISAGTSTGSALNMTGDTSGALALATNNGTTAVTIDTSQNVGIGTSSFLNSEKLQVKGSALGTTAGNTAYNTVFYTPDTSNTTRLSVLDFRVSNGSSHTSSINKIQRRVDGSDMGFVGFGSSGSGNNVVSFGNGTTQYAGFDSSGNLGIGTSSPVSVLHLNTSSANTVLQLTNSTTGTAITDGFSIICQGTTNDTILSQRESANLIFRTADTERARIDSSGNLLVGTTSVLGTSAAGTTHINGGANDANEAPLYLRNQFSTAGRYWKVGPVNNAGFLVFNNSNVGQYQSYGATSWTATSDERLKTNLLPIENAAQKISSLRAVTGRYKTDEQNVSRSFLIAQDVQAVFPEAVDVQDDEQNTLGLRYTEVIPLLVAAIQELKAIVDAQAVEIAALKST